MLSQNLGFSSSGSIASHVAVSAIYRITTPPSKTIQNGGQAEADRARHHRCEGNADDHCHQLKSLAHGVGLGSAGIIREQLREEGAVIGVDHRIEVPVRI